MRHIYFQASNCILCFIGASSDDVDWGTLGVPFYIGAAIRRRHPTPESERHFLVSTSDCTQLAQQRSVLIEKINSQKKSKHKHFEFDFQTLKLSAKNDR
jgi:hypothetical protein